MNQQVDSGRLHALDNLRAIMMWLGIVLHVALNHLTQDSPMPWRDPASSPVANLLMIFIHSFRMPVFFILAGFLAAMMVEKYGYKTMLRKRARRIALPFALFWPFLFAGMVFLILVFGHLMANGTLGIDLKYAPKPPAGGTKGPPTMHMWFIYYLMWFCMLAAAFGAVGKYLPASVGAAVAKTMRTLAAKGWGALVLAIPLAIVGAQYKAGMLSPNGSFIPNLNETVHSGLFFLAGWMIYGVRDTLLPMYKADWIKYLVAGTVPFLICCKLFALYAASPATTADLFPWIAFFYAVTSWLWSFGLIGLFLRFLPHQNRVLRYISDSSYWVFLVHMLGTMGFGVLLFNAPLGALTKMGLNIALTTMACLLSYHFLVRRTWIGTLLNGKKHLRPAPVPDAATA